jgi:nitrite reductase/ring-hydroxylating ferredoxin subunit
VGGTLGGRPRLMPATDEGWASAGAFEALPEGKGAKVEVGDAIVLLVRSGERVFAIGNRCTHQGAPLDRGRVKLSGSLATVTCPAHGSVFGLEEGRVMRGPATKPVASYETRVVDGTVEVRARLSE